MLAAKVGGIPEIFGPFTDGLVHAGAPDALAHRHCRRVDDPARPKSAPDCYASACSSTSLRMRWSRACSPAIARLSRNINVRLPALTKSSDFSANALRWANPAADILVRLEARRRTSRSWKLSIPAPCFDGLAAAATQSSAVPRIERRRRLTPTALSVVERESPFRLCADRHHRPRPPYGLPADQPDRHRRSTSVTVRLDGLQLVLHPGDLHGRRQRGAVLPGRRHLRSRSSAAICGR